MLTTKWDEVQVEYGKMSQLGHQAVLQAAKVGQMLIDLKAVTEHGDWAPKLSRAINLPTAAANIAGAKLMRLAPVDDALPPQPCKVPAFKDELADFIMYVKVGKFTSIFRSPVKS